MEDEWQRIDVKKFSFNRRFGDQINKSDIN